MRGATWLVLGLIAVTSCGSSEKKKDSGDDTDDDKPKKKKKKKSPESMCGTLYDKYAECEKGMAKELGEDKFIDMCVKAMDMDMKRDDLDDELACAEKDSCEDFKSCRKGITNKRRVTRLLKEIDDGKYDSALSTCMYSDEQLKEVSFRAACMRAINALEKVTDATQLDRLTYSCSGSTFERVSKQLPELATVCQKINGNKLELLTTQVTAARDAGRRDYSACSSLDRAARAADGDVPGPRTAAAKTLCDEMNASEAATRARSEAASYLASKRNYIPYQCNYAAMTLSRMTSTWATTTYDQLIRACYVDLGVALIDAELAKGAISYCPMALREIVRAERSYSIAAKYPAFQAAYKKLPETCTKY